MKLELFINLLDLKKKIEEGNSKIQIGRVDLRNTSSLGERALQETAYRLSLSGRNLSNAQTLTQVVKDRNEVRAALKRTSDGKQEKLEIPPSLTALLEKPNQNFHSFISNLLQNPQALVASHSDIDAERAMHLLAAN